MSVFILKNMHWIWQIQWTTGCLKMRLTLSKVKHLLLLFTLPRTLCSSQNNFPMRVTWLILIFSPLCLALFLKWPSDASLPNPTLLYNCSSFTASRNWQKEIWSSHLLQPIFQGWKFLRGSCTTPHFDTFSCYDFIHIFHICRFFLPIRTIKFHFFGLQWGQSGSERLSLGQSHTSYDCFETGS